MRFFPRVMLACSLARIHAMNRASAVLLMLTLTSPALAHKTLRCSIALSGRASLGLGSEVGHALRWRSAGALLHPMGFTGKQADEQIGSSAVASGG